MAKKATSKKKESSKKKPLTTAHRLGNWIKSARDIMRIDKGLNGELNRLPMLTWIMFLKFPDDIEQIREVRVRTEKAKQHRKTTLSDLDALMKSVLNDVFNGQASL